MRARARSPDILDIFFLFFRYNEEKCHGDQSSLLYNTHTQKKKFTDVI